MKKIITACACLLFVSACARDMDANTYRSNATVGKVLRGTIVNVQPITIRNNDSTSQNALGGVAGGAAGAAAGSTVGGGSGKTVATVGGAIAGAVIGALIEEELATQSGYEYVVQLDNPAPRSQDSIRIKETQTRRGSASIEDDIKDSIHLQQSQSD